LKIPRIAPELQSAESPTVSSKLATYEKDVEIATQARGERKITGLKPVRFEKTLEEERKREKQERRDRQTANEGDLKRRRASHRAKNVRKTQRSQTEV